MNTNEILFRCSQLGRLMTEPKSKSETLSETAKKYLIEVYIHHKYGRKKDITSKHITKGLMVEEDSITLYSRVKKQLFFKNNQQLKNDYIIGTPDLFIGETIENAEVIIDTKSSWDLWTFYDAKTAKKINPAYDWQLQGYMWLSGAKKAELTYCLIDTPEVLIADEKRRFMWNSGTIDENKTTDEVFKEIEKNCRFDDIHFIDRVHTIAVDYDAEKIEQLKQKVESARQWIAENLLNL